MTRVPFQGGTLVIRKVVLAIFNLLAVVMWTAPAFAQESGQGHLPIDGWSSQMYSWALISGAFALGIAAASGAYAQSRAIAAACDGISRNPGASGQIRFALILGLALIESLVIYVLLIAFIIFLVLWGG